MAFGLKNASTDVLLLNHVDNIILDSESSPENKKETRCSPLRTRKSRLFFISLFLGLSIFICGTILVYYITNVEYSQFHSDVILCFDTKYQDVDSGRRSQNIHDLVELNNEGSISSDAEFEVYVMVAFDEFNAKFNKKDENDADRLRRFTNFRLNFIKVYECSQDDLYFKKLNEFSDKSDEDMESLLLVNPEPLNFSEKFIGYEENDCPAAAYLKNPVYMSKLRLAKGLSVIKDICKITGHDIDWRQVNGVTPIKYQQDYSSSWAFAAVASVESLYLIQTNQDLELSPQELLNCTEEKIGSLSIPVHSALTYIRDYGISKEEDVPYVGKNEECGLKASKRKIYINSFVSAIGHNIPRFLLPLGPVVVSVAVDDSWYTYGGGIFNGSCGKALNHTVLLVGEGYDEVLNKHYWIIKNSWGESWGESGYMKLERLSVGSDKCQILTVGRLPTL